MPLDHEILEKLPSHLKEMIELFREIRESNSRVEKKILKIESGLSELVQHMEQTSAATNERINQTEKRMDKNDADHQDHVDKIAAIRVHDIEDRQKAMDQLDSIQQDIRTRNEQQILPEI